jgi:hypothetical protein
MTYPVCVLPMPTIKLTTFFPGSSLPITTSTGTLLIPRPQFRCWVRLPNTFMPRDGIIDTGSPLSRFPESIWSHFQQGWDFEWLPYEAGFNPPRGQAAGWSFTFRIAQMLQPLSLFDAQTELVRSGTIVQFADGNPPAPPGSKRPPRVIIGLWGGVLEGTSLHFSTDAATGHVVGSLEW